jgi:putative transposase
LAEWPLPRPRGWLAHVNRPQTAAEVAAVQESIRRGTPYGSEQFIKRSARQLDLQSTLRPRGRPPKKET